MRDEDIIKLYTSFKDDARGWLSLHRQHFTQFVSIILAILAATVTAFIKLKDEPTILYILISGPALNIALSFMAIKVCNKFYRRYSEHDAISYKIYLALEKNPDFNDKLHSSNLFPNRWIRRLKKFPIIDDYSSSRLYAIDASNTYITITFVVLIITSLALIAIITRAASNV